LTSQSSRGELLIGTTNPAKAERLRWVLSGLGFRFVELRPDDGPGPDESGLSFAENAKLKACYWSSRLGLTTVASDGGLVIPALGERWNALLTARSAGPRASDLERAEHLLRLARELRGEQRGAYWVEALALAADGHVLGCWEAHGTKAYLVSSFSAGDLKPGFWAASLCRVPSLGRTLAQLGDEELDERDPTWASLRRAVRQALGSG
jgi:XTP/dITP diphosphohydrolase